MLPAIGLRREIGIAEAISALRPGQPWVVRGGSYENFEWFGDPDLKPTLAEIEEKIAQLVDEEPMRVLREIRDWYLGNSDWTQLQDIRAIRGQEWCDAWDEYRQRLRDMPDTSNPYFDENGNITGVAFPALPPS